MSSAAFATHGCTQFYYTWEIVGSIAVHMNGLKITFENVNQQSRPDVFGLMK